MTWTDITLRQFNQIKGLDLTDPEGQIRLIEVITGKDLDDCTLAEFQGLKKEISFLDEPIPEVLPKQAYCINGRDYRCNLNLAEMTVSQYMDFTNLVGPNSDKDFAQILSVFIIPKDKKYATEYDITQVQDDLNDMPIVDAYAVFNFFRMQFIACFKTMTDYLDKQMKKGKVSKEFRQKILDTMDSFFTSVQ